MFSGFEPLVQMGTMFMCRLKLLGVSLSRQAPQWNRLLRLANKTCLWTFMSDVRSHSCDWPKLGSENGGTPPTVAWVSRLRRHFEASVGSTTPVNERLKMRFEGLTLNIPLPNQLWAMQGRHAGNPCNSGLPRNARDIKRQRRDVYISTPTLNLGREKRCLTTMERSSASDTYCVDRPATAPAVWTSAQGQAGQGRGSESWIKALTIALGQASEGKSYLSTLELQLASFETCVACRGVHTLRVTVDKGMPLSLWGDDDSSNFFLKAPERRRLPSVRAAGVAWKLRAGMLVPLLSEAALLREVGWLRLTGFAFEYYDRKATTLSRRDDFSQPATRIGHSPKRYFDKTHIFISRGKKRARCLSWPSALRELSLGCIPNELVDWVALPRSLERLALGAFFHESIVAWLVSFDVSHFWGLLQPADHWCRMAHFVGATDIRVTLRPTDRRCCMARLFARTDLRW